MSKLDFNFQWRPWRIVYIATITFFIYAFTENLWSLLALLAIVDLTIDDIPLDNTEVTKPLYGPDSHD